MTSLSARRSVGQRLRERVEFIKRKYPYRVQCNVCNWKGRVLSSDAWHPFTICPQCKSQVRHRLLIAAMTKIDDVHVGNLGYDRRVIHFAPERVLSQFLRDGAAEYVTADLFRDNVDLTMDMCDMEPVANGCFDLLVACDVLEHVRDDVKALAEIHRILSTNGWAVLTVPQKDDLATKYEDQTITTPEGRKDAFGQEDHLRIYGNDFGSFLESHGFDVTEVDEQAFDSETVKKHVLFPPVLSTHPLATNHRRVYFARKK